MCQEGRRRRPGEIVFAIVFNRKKKKKGTRPDCDVRKKVAAGEERKRLAKEKKDGG